MQRIFHDPSSGVAVTVDADTITIHSAVETAAGWSATYVKPETVVPVGGDKLESRSDEKIVFIPNMPGLWPAIEEVVQAGARRNGRSRASRAA